MEISILEQTKVFLYAILTGFLIGVCYETVRFLRVAGFKKKYHIVLSDIFFMIFAAFVTFLLALGLMEGRVRFYILLGEFIGLIIFRYTLGELLSMLYVKVIKAVCLIVSWPLKKSKKIMKTLLKIVAKPLYNKRRDKKDNEKSGHKRGKRHDKQRHKESGQNA